MIFLLFIHLIRILYCFLKFDLFYVRLNLFLWLSTIYALTQDSTELLRRLSGQLCLWINRRNSLKYDHWTKINHLFNIFMNLLIKLGPKPSTDRAYDSSIHINYSISFILFRSESFYGQWVWLYKNIHILQLGIQYLIWGPKLQRNFWWALLVYVVRVCQLNIKIFHIRQVEVK